MYCKMTNLGEAMQVVHDKFNRPIKLMPNMEVEAELHDKVVKVFQRAQAAGGALHIEVLDQPEETEEKKPRQRVRLRTTPEEAEAAEEAVEVEEPKLPAGAQGNTPRPIKRAEPKPVKRTTPQEVEDTRPAGAPRTAAQVLAKVGTISHTELVSEAKRLLGATKVKNGATESDIVYRLRRLAAAGK